MVLLGRTLLHAVEINRSNRVFFIYGQVLRTTIELSSTRVYDSDPRIHLSAEQKKLQLRDGVEEQVTMRLRHAVRMADLACDVEHNIRACCDARNFQVHLCRMPVHQLRSATDRTLNSLAPQPGTEEWTDGHFSAFSDEPVYEITADESKAARHQAM